MSEGKESTWDLLVENADLLKEKKYRASVYEEKSCHAADRDDPQNAGWETFWESKNKKKIKLRKEKVVGDAFEDKVWTMFSRLGFAALNKGRKFTLHDGPGHNQQIDVFAVDSESVILVECKATAERKPSNFKKQIEAFEGQQTWIKKLVAEKFPGKKVKFIWAMSNYYASKSDLDRIATAGMTFFDEDSISYYTDLAGHLGTCAKYQLFARIFANSPIANFEERIPAIKSKLGKCDCYTFSIDPARLLKLGYILHHHPTNNDLMPAYQRLIKKSRLIKIREFVEGGGYFANSLILSIDTKGRGVKFDEIKTGIESNLSSMGVLHLPAAYCSAYVIDGQHRLYAYSDSALAATQSVPVVAFIDLHQRDQLKLFMDINENQKSVPKSLRVTLNADMLWDSPSPAERRQAIASKIAQQLEDKKDSKLYGRIIVGENETSKYRRVTVFAIQDAIAKSGLLNTYAKNSAKPTSKGLLDFDDNDKTREMVYNLIYLCIDHIYELCPKAWGMTDDEATILVTNRGIQAIIRVIGDILRFLVDKGYTEDPLNSEVEDIAKDVVCYLDPLCDFFNEVTDEQRRELRNFLGGSADTKFWREFQRVIHKKFPDFDPPDLQQYLLDETKQFNTATKQNIEAISAAVQKRFKDNFFVDFNTEDDCLHAFPRTVYHRLTKLMSDYSYEHKVTEVSFHQFITIGDMRDIASAPNLWVDKFEPLLTPPWVAKKSGKKVKLEWMDFIETLTNKINNKGFSVSAKDAERVQEIYGWLVEDNN